MKGYPVTQDAWSAAQKLIGMPPQTAARLTDAALDALVQTAAQQASTARRRRSSACRHLSSRG